MTGESYAVRETAFAYRITAELDTIPQGRYLPVFASNVFDLNTRLVEGNYTPINLASLAIGRCTRSDLKVHLFTAIPGLGNGLTDFLQFSLSTYDMQCTPASLPPIQTIK